MRFMNLLKTFFSFLHAIFALLFIGVALILVVTAVKTGIDAAQNISPEAAQEVIEALGLLAVAVVSLQIAQTIVEEEVIREAHISAPTRVRRYISRFLVVVVVSLAIEGLVATFKALHETPELLPHAASIIVAVGFLLMGWGVFVWCNRSAEELEPEAMAQAKQEDHKLE